MAAVPQRKPRECQDVTRNSLLDGEGQKRANDSTLLRKRQMMDKGEKNEQVEMEQRKTTKRTFVQNHHSCHGISPIITSKSW